MWNLYLSIHFYKFSLSISIVVVVHALKQEKMLLEGWKLAILEKTGRQSFYHVHLCENPDVFSRYAGFTYVQVEDSLFLKHEYYPPKNVPTASEICHEKSFPKDETIPWFLSLPTL